MKISALIPSYNAGKTIETTLASVFSQSVQPTEILVLNDGSNDDTLARLEKYEDRITVLSQKNGGVARARNRLVKAARGDILAFLDSDDIWHTHYLETQSGLLKSYPEVVASFTGHINFPDGGVPDWSSTAVDERPEAVIYQPDSFIRAYNATTGLFASMSYTCVRKAAIEVLPGEPFHPDVTCCEDSYLCYRLALVGPVARVATQLAAYRITKGSLSTNVLYARELWVRVFELLEPEYARQSSPELKRSFRMGFSTKRRVYARTLLGVGEAAEARRQLCLSLCNCCGPTSAVKSLALLLLSLAPKRLQPRWPSAERVVNSLGGK